MKVYKMILMFVDRDDLGQDGAREILEVLRDLGTGYSPSVMSVEERDVKWSDSNPLNNSRTMGTEFARLFGKESEE